MTGEIDVTEEDRLFRETIIYMDARVLYECEVGGEEMWVLYECVYGCGEANGGGRIYRFI